MSSESSCVQEVLKFNIGTSNVSTPKVDADNTLDQFIKTDSNEYFCPYSKRKQIITSVFGDTSKLSVVVKRIGASQASKLLMCNKSNRHMYSTIVADYKSKMKNGKWTLQSDSISFDEQFILTNGQHRLQAVLESGVECEFIFAFNIEKSLYCDTGRHRSFFDNATINDAVPDFMKNKVICDCVKSLVTVYKGSIYGKDAQNLVDFSNKYKSFIIQAHNLGLITSSIKAPICGGLLSCLICGAEPEYLTRIIKYLKEGVSTNGELDKPIFALSKLSYELKGGGSASSLVKATQYCYTALKSKRYGAVCKTTKELLKIKF